MTTLILATAGQSPTGVGGGGALLPSLDVGARGIWRPTVAR